MTTHNPMGCTTIIGHAIIAGAIGLMVSRLTDISNIYDSQTITTGECLGMIAFFVAFGLLIVRRSVIAGQKYRQW